MTDTSKKFHFNNLDSIRSIAFLSTFLAHAFYAESPEILASKAYQNAISFSEYFSFGVPIFFVLSGFLITYLMLREQQIIGTFSLKDFYMRRILRIWPVFFMVLFIGFVAFPILRAFFLDEPYYETADWRMYATFLSNFDQINQPEMPYGVGLGPTWSVSIEEQYYLAWPLLLLFFNRKKFIIPIILVVMASLFFSAVYHLSNIHTLYCMTYLGVGAGFAYLAFYHERFTKRITTIPRGLFLLVVCLLFTLILLSTRGYGTIFMIFAIALTIGYIILYQCYSGKMTLKSIPFLERWGKYTYGLYLYHVICIFVVHTLLGKIAGIPESLFTILILKPILSIGLSMILSYYSYHYFERFFLNLKTKFTPRANP